MSEREFLGVQQIGRRCMVALGVLALLACIEAVVLSSQATLLKSEVLVAHFSGQQRLRMSRFGIILIRLGAATDPQAKERIHALFRETVAEYVAAHERLVHGAPGEGFPVPPASVKAVLEQEPNELLELVT